MKRLNCFQVLAILTFALGSVADRIQAQMLNYAVNSVTPQSVGRTN